MFIGYRKYTASKAFDPASLFMRGEKGFVFDPTRIETMFTDAGVTRVTADNDAVWQINDLSGNNYTGLQAAAGDRLLYNTTTHAAGCIQTVSSDKLDVTSTAAGVMRNKSYGTIIAFCNIANPATNGYIVCFSSNATAGTSRLVLATTSTGKASLISRRADADTFQQLNSTASVNGADHILIAECDWARKLTSISIDLNSPETAIPSWAAGVSADTDSVGVSIGGDNIGANTTVGDIGRAIVIDRQLTPVERTRAIRWCGNVYGMSL